MAVTVKPAADAAKKWTTNAAGAQAFYQAGVTAAGPAWEANTAAAAKNFQSAVQAANIGQLFAGGVKKAGGAKYSAKAANLGASRFSGGVQAATSDYQNGVQPYLDTISGLTLQARAPRGSVTNLQRVQQIATALNTKRLALRAAGA